MLNVEAERARRVDEQRCRFSRKSAGGQTAHARGHRDDERRPDAALPSHTGESGAAQDRQPRDEREDGARSRAPRTSSHLLHVDATQRVLDEILGLDQIPLAERRLDCVETAAEQALAGFEERSRIDAIHGLLAAALPLRP